MKRNRLAFVKNKHQTFIPSAARSPALIAVSERDSSLRSK